MEGVVFWIVPASLILGLIFLVAQKIQLSRRQKMLVIEPIGTIVTDWQVARVEPNTEAVKRLFKAIASANLSTGSLLERVIISAATKIGLKSKASKLLVLSQQPISPLGERFTLELAGSSQSILVGPLDQMAELIDDEKLDQFHHLSLQAAEHGYLAIAIATAFVHGQSKKIINHRLEGMILLEPVIDHRPLSSDKSVRFLSAAPLKFSARLYEQFFPTGPPFGLNAEELNTLAPKFAEADLFKAIVIGSADLQSRHRVLQSWQQHFGCRYLTVNPEDADLPKRS